MRGKKLYLNEKNINFWITKFESMLIDWAYDPFTISIISSLKLINYRPPEITFSLKYRGYGGKEGSSKLFLRVSNFWVNRLRVSSFRMIRRIFRKKIGKTWWKIKHAYELCVIEPACSSIVLNSLAMSRSKEHVVHTYTNVKRLVWDHRDDEFLFFFLFFFIVIILDRDIFIPFYKGKWGK